MADWSHRFCMVLAWTMFTATSVMMIVICRRRFYEVTEFGRPFIIKIGMMGYCSSMNLPDGFTKCVGPPNRIGWTFESVGTYLLPNLTTHVEDLRGSVTSETTRPLRINLIFLGISMSGSILSLTSFFVKEPIRRLLAFVLLPISLVSFPLSIATVVIIKTKTSSEIRKGIEHATNGSLQLTTRMDWRKNGISFVGVTIGTSLLAIMFCGLAVWAEKPRPTIDTTEMERL